jgi:hypothetical protein
LNESGYVPQIYDQLAAAYRREGRDKDARKVAIAKQYRSGPTVGKIQRIFNWFLYLTVGYGYRTWLAGIWLAGLIIGGVVAFSYAYPGHMTRLGSNSPSFHAFPYTMDILVPVVNFGQQRGWQANGWAMWLGWILTIIGWLLTTAVVAGVARVLRKE